MRKLYALKGARTVLGRGEMLPSSPYLTKVVSLEKGGWNEGKPTEGGGEFNEVLQTNKHNFIMILGWNHPPRYGWQECRM